MIVAETGATNPVQSLSRLNHVLRPLLSVWGTFVFVEQVALSLWLLFALVAEAPSIAAQVLGARWDYCSSFGK